MLNTLFQAVPQFIQTRLATRQLTHAIMRGDIDDMSRALAKGADPQKVTYEYPASGPHLSEQNKVHGALNVAAQEKLPLEAFELLVRYGARIGSPIYGSHPDGWKFGNTIDMLIERTELENNTAAAPALPRKVTRL